MNAQKKISWIVLITLIGLSACAPAAATPVPTAWSGSAEQAARSCRRARAFDGAFVWHQELDPFPVRFPIDIVFTWVDGDDPAWQERKHRTLIAAGREVAHHPESIVESRYRSRDELRYALRSILEYAPWFNRLFLVTDRQVPAWLEIAHPRLTVVDHADLGPIALALLKRGIPAGTPLRTGGEHPVAAEIDVESLPPADVAGAGRVAVDRLRHGH